MSYADRMTKVFDTHWGGGYTEVYDVDEFRVVITFSTGSSIAVYNKEDLPIEKVKPGWNHMLWSYLPAKSLADGWWYMDETVEQAVDRNIDKIKNPQQVIWYGKVPPPPPGTLSLHHQTINYTSDVSPENIKRIEALPEFAGWYEEEPWFKELREKYGPK